MTRDSLAAASVLVVGDVMLDRYWFGDVDRISPEAPVPIVHVKREEFRLGGAANVALNIAALGGKVALLSVIGDDEAGERVTALVEAAGIESMLHRDRELQTTVKLRVSGRAQQLLRIDFERCPATDAINALTNDFRDAVSGFDTIVMSDYGKGGISHTQEKIQLARTAGKPVLIDPKGSDYSSYSGATALTPNRSELAQVVGAWQDERDLHRRAFALRKLLKLEALVLTRSEEGISVFDRDGEMRVPTQTREVFDVTGAGDTVIAVAATAVAHGYSLRDAITLANKAAGIVVGKFGTATVTYEELFAE